MQISWEGHYLDGRTAARQRVTIRLMASGLQVVTADGETAWWPYHEIRQTQGSYRGEQVRLEREGAVGEALLIEDVAFLTALRQAAPERTSQFHDPAGRRRRVYRTVLAGLVAIVIAAALYLWGIPALAQTVAARVPVAWEERLGQAVVDHLAPAGKRCAGPAGTRLIGDIVNALTAALAGSPYTFRVLVVDEPTVNAFAAPGGSIVIFRGLLERTRSAEELAGVLAHEIQHVQFRHATRALLQHASIGLLLAALAGDPTGAMTYGLETARTLGTLRYSRRNEEEADEEGLRLLLGAGIDPSGMIAFFESLRREDTQAEPVLKYLSTHPLTAERIQRAKALAGPVRRAPVRLLPNRDWREIRTICQAPGKPA